METAAYVVALLLVVTMPPAVLYWFLIHPFAERWRKLGPGPTIAAGFLAMAALGYAIWQVREPLLRVRFGFSPYLTGLGVVLYLIGAYLEIRCRRHLKLRILVGIPELSADDPGRVLTEGIYGRVRHPRYLAFLFALTGFALFANYLALYLVIAAVVPLGYLMVLLEERELRQRFGAEYEEYMRRVPRWVPRRETAASPPSS